MQNGIGVTWYCEPVNRQSSNFTLYLINRGREPCKSDLQGPRSDEFGQNCIYEIPSKNAGNVYARMLTALALRYRSNSRPFGKHIDWKRMEKRRAP